MKTERFGFRRVGTFLIVCVLMSGTTANAAEDSSVDESGQKQRTLGVLLYPGFELLDVFGPVEMLINVPSDKLRVVMIAEEAGEVEAGSLAGQQAPKVVADYGFDDAPHLDLILVPGGVGTFPALRNRKLLDWVRDRAAKAEITTSVCTGSVILAKAGVLDDRKATTNKQFYKVSTGQAPEVDWVEKARWVEDGNVITSSGVSAGIDMSLALIARLYGVEMAEQIAEATEYVWARDPGDDPFSTLITKQD